MVGSVSLSLFLYLSLYRSLLRCFFITLHRVGLYLSRYNLCLLGEGRCELLTPIQFFFASLLLSIETLSTVNEFAPPSQAVVCVLRARFHARGVEVGHRGRLPKQPFFLIRFAFFFFFLSFSLSLFPVSVYKRYFDFAKFAFHDISRVTEFSRSFQCRVHRVPGVCRRRTEFNPSNSDGNAALTPAFLDYGSVEPVRG